MALDLKKDLDKYKQFVEETIVSENIREAFDFIQYIRIKVKETNLEKDDLGIYNEYKKMAIKLRWIAFSLLEESEILELIKKRFADIFSLSEYNDYDLWRHLKMKLLQELSLDKRNQFKLKIRQALRASIQPLVKTPNNNMRTVGDWVNDYIKNMGEAMVPKIERLNFLQKNHTFNTLNERDQKKIKYLIDFYERLKISSKSLMGTEEEILVPEEESRMTVIKDGEIIAPSKRDPLKPLDDILAEQDKLPIAEPEKRTASKADQIINNRNAEELKVLQNKYPVGSLERKAIEEELRKSSKK